MKKRPFGTNKTMVSEVGLGTWQIGGSWGGTVEDKTAMNILQTASDAGITFFDTADVYGDGRSEKFIGKFLKSNRDSFFCCNQIGTWGGRSWLAW